MQDLTTPLLLETTGCMSIRDKVPFMMMQYLAIVEDAISRGLGVTQGGDMQPLLPGTLTIL